MPDTETSRKISVLLEIGRYNEALAKLDQLLARDPDNYTSLCQKSICLYRLHKYQQAYDISKLAISASPDKEWAYRIQSLIFSSNGENGRALEAARMSVEKAPFASESIQTLFYAQIAFGLLEEARGNLDILRMLAPESANSHIAAGFLALKDKNLETAETEFLNALALNPESTDALNNLGVTYSELAKRGQRKKYSRLSAEMFKQALRTEPTYKHAQENL